MRSVIPILVVMTLLAAADSHACVGKSFTPIVELRSSQPLLASPDGDNSQSIAIDASGCVKVHFPAFDTRAGTYGFRLDPAEFAGLKRELRSSKVMNFDAAAVKRELLAHEAQKVAQPVLTGYRVTDEEVLELSLLGDAIGDKRAAPQQVTWTGLREQLLNHPELDALVGLAAVRERLVLLTTDTRKTRVQP
jgi:hypothetical protein